MKSIITDDMEHCYLCGTTQNIQWHHCIFGIHRKNADKYGLIVPLCIFHHTGSNEAVHSDEDIAMYFRKLAQQKFEETHTREEFMQIFGRNYLD